MAEAIAKCFGLPISTKQSVEVCNFIRGRPIEWVKKTLADVVKQKIAVPYKRYNDNVGHRPGMMSGRYPMKTCKHILAIVNSAEKNAQFKGINSSDLIVNVIANKASKVNRYGRKPGKSAKRTNIFVELAKAKEEKKEKDNNAKQEAKK